MRRPIPRHLAALLPALILAGLALVPTAAFAQDPTVWCGPPVPPCDPYDVNSPCYMPPPEDPRCEPEEDCKCAKSPCFVGSGTYKTGFVDLALPTAGQPLVAGRTYQSSQTIDGPMGYGWSPTVGARLYEATYLLAAPSTTQKIAYLVMPDGARYTFTENADGTYSAPSGRYDRLVRNPDGSFDLTLQRSRSVMHFGATGPLTAISDDYGNTLQFNYDGSGRLQRIADASGSGRYLDVSWGPDGRISGIQDSAAGLVQYTYTPQGALATVTDAADRVTRYSYVPGRFAPLLSRIADHWQRVVSDITYDASDRVRSYTENGETFTYTYAYQGNAAQTAKSDSAGNTYVYRFVSGGLVSDTIPPGGGLIHADYYPDGSIQQAIDAAGVKSYFTYTQDGRVESVTWDYQGLNPVRFDYTYDPIFPAKVIAITPRNPSTNAVNTDWQAWQYDYYPAGSPSPETLFHVYRVRSDGATRDTMATYEYDSRGRVVRSINAAGGVTDFVFDGAGNLTTVTGPVNDDSGSRPVTTFGDHDEAGRPRSLTDPLGHTTTYTFDNLGRQTSVTLPKPASGSPLTFATAYSYDHLDASSGLVFTHVTDPNGGVSKLGFDQHARIVRSVNALNHATTYGYTRDLLTSITDAHNNVIGYGYDMRKRLVRTTFPAGTHEDYTYYPDDLLQTVTDRKGQAILYEHDAFKRLKKKTYVSPAQTITYSYQGQKLTQVASLAETHTFAYDSSYRISSNTQGPRGTLSYTYTSDDRLASMAIAGGPTATYAYHPDGGLNTIAWTPVSGEFKYVYTPNGQYESTLFPNGQHRDSTYDDQGRLTRIANISGANENLATFDYGYDLDHTTGTPTMLGQRTSMTANVPAQGFTNAETKYSYDALYQLTRADYPAGAPFGGEIHRWTYDAIGNRLTNTVNESTQTSVYDYGGTPPNPANGRRLLNDGARSYAYDLNGSLITASDASGSTSFGYDADDRLTSISCAAAATYGYDYRGRRTSKTVGGVTTTYLYDGLNLVAETTGGVATHYVFGPAIDEVLAVSGGGTVRYAAVDGMGTSVGENDAAGVLEHHSVFDAWGAIRSETGARPSAFGYTGREFGEAGLHFYRARFLDPSTGRFTQEDPLRVVNFDTYRYVFGDPVSFRDPTGEPGTLVTAGIGILIGGAWGYAVGGTSGMMTGAIAGGVTGLTLGLAGPAVFGWLGGGIVGGAGAGVASSAVGNAVAQGYDYLSGGQEGFNWPFFVFDTAAGGVGGGLILRPFRPTAGTCRISQWPRREQTPFRGNPWAMVGDPTAGNWLRTFVPWRYRLGDGVRKDISSSQLAWPSGLDGWKGHVGQVIIKK